MVDPTKVFSILKNFSLDKATLFTGDSQAGKTRIEPLKIDGQEIPRFINEFWTSRQRQASSIHEISYRACYKPQLPRFFINLFTRPGDLVYDPFNGRGTTIIEAALLNRKIVANDANPLSEILSRPRLFVPQEESLAERLSAIPLQEHLKAEIDISMFYHPKTEAEIVSLKNYLFQRHMQGTEDEIDGWIRMIATNRLTGHSPGFFSVYTLPPNQAVSPESQQKINRKRNQQPEYRDIRKIILRKTRRMLGNVSAAQVQALRTAGKTARFFNSDARSVPEIESDSVALTVTSPPFLNVVQYSKDNWLRCWFNGIDVKAVEKKITMTHSLKEWTEVMQDVFRELYRITTPGGWVAFEVGEVKKKSLNLDEVVVPLGISAGFDCAGILINSQKFTKTANIWGVSNNQAGTNTNRIVLFRK